MTDVDLRSDTITRPTAAMREAMARAEVGDDVFGEDPTVQRLQERAAELLGKEAALFVPSGTMANQIALLVHCERGDEVLVGEGAHCMLYESGAGSAWAGVSFGVVGSGGTFTAEQMSAAVKPLEYHFPRTRLVALENTHNRGGGLVFPQREVIAIAQVARARGLAVHLDGARLWNAAVATGSSPAVLAAPADTVSACFSKGLGAPVGSVLAGPRVQIARAHRFRKMLGGGMRQAGVLAAAALYALEHHRERLAVDHAHAKRLAEALHGADGAICPADRVQTNIVMIDLPPNGPLEAAVVADRAGRLGVRLLAIAPRRLRAVLSLEVTEPMLDQAIDRLRQALSTST
jgi:threonine aldolase